LAEEETGHHCFQTSFYQPGIFNQTFFVSVLAIILALVRNFFAAQAQVSAATGKS
jgi:hypothetical protein